MIGQAYLGALGQTRTTTLHVSDAHGALVLVEVYVGIDAEADPALAAQLRGDALNVAWLDGRELRIAVPVIYHDPAARLLVLVLGDAHRHGELDERIRVLEQLRDDPADVPAYAKDFAVVFGAAGLRAYLDQRTRPGAHRITALARSQVSDPFAGDPDADLAPVPEIEDAPLIDDGDFDSDPGADDVPADGTEMGAEPHFDLDVGIDVGSDAYVALDVAAAHDAAIDGSAARITEPSLDADAVGELAAALDAEAVAGDGRLPDTLPEGAIAIALGRRAITIEPPDPAAPGTDPLTTEVSELALELTERQSRIDESRDDSGAPPAATDEAPHASGDPQGATDQAQRASGEPQAAAGAGDPEADWPEAGWHIKAGAVHLVFAVDDALEAALAGPLDLRLVLHRTPHAPVIALVLGSPAALRATTPERFAVATLDVAEEPDRSVLRTLGRSFEIIVTVSRDGRAIRRCRLSAPLADNVGYLVQAADEHWSGLVEHVAPDQAAARALVLADGFDLLGLGHPERTALRADKLAQIATARQLRRALAIARHFTWPASEDYLVCLRGFPLSLWHQLRRAAVARAVAWGLWMGPELAQIAVSEGFARSRRDLIARLDRGFEQLRHDPRAFDIDAEATADNAAAIADQARALGVQVRAGMPDGAGAIASAAASVAAGSIDLTPLPESPPRTIDELLVLLDDTTAGRGGRTRRLAAALALCDLGDPRAAGPVIAAALKMSRGEAVRVLARAVKLGAAAQPALIAGLTSSKAYLRHGCALALALARTDEATQAVTALLLSEPTELWHEIARAIGQIGTGALVYLVRDVTDQRPGSDERIAWAMAHVAANGAISAVTAMAAADSIVAPIAAKALELLALETAARSDAEPDAAGSQAERDLSVNHAFSRQFFEALDGAREETDAGSAPLAAES